MKYILSILFVIAVSCVTMAIPVEEPLAFEKFFKPSMKVTPGAFPVYQDGTKFFLEIPAHALNSDILVIGDIARGPGNILAQSSGIIRFSLGTGNILNVTKQVYKEATSPDFNQGIEDLVQKSNLIPVSYIITIVASGKEKNSYIIDITRQLIESGELFSFKDFSGLANSDATRSGVQQVQSTADAVIFTVLRTQTNPGNVVNGIKMEDKAVAFLVNLVIQQLPVSSMKVREADQRIGFGTVSYNDFGKNPYGIRNVKAITKWNLQIAATDQRKYDAGKLLSPIKPIKIFIDKTTPSLFVPYIKEAIAQWNVAFQAAGFKNALVFTTDENDDWLSFGKILIKWGNASNGVATNLVTDPRTGEILTAKMTISDDVVNELLPSYFAKCGLKDPRILKNLYDPAIRGEMMRWKVAQALGQLFGMTPNLHGSTAYTTDQLRSGSWLKDNSFSASVTDDTQFNFVVQPEDQIAVKDLTPSVSSYDEMAIGWAYRIFDNRKAEQKALGLLDYSNTTLLFLEENKNDPFTQHGDLSSNQLDASILGMKNIMLFYPQLEKISGSMKGNDEDWSNFKLLSTAFQKSYQLYIDNVVNYIGGLSMRPILKNYNEVPVIYTPKKDQQKAMALLNTWLFSGTPAWMQNKKMNLLNNESEDVKMQRCTQIVLKKLISPITLGNLISTEYALGKDAYTASNLFDDLDHYVFKDFNTTAPLDEYTRVMQANFIFDLVDVAVKNNIASGLTDTSEVIHLYFVRTIGHIKELAQQHQDPATRALYQMINQKAEQELSKKRS